MSNGLRGTGRFIAGGCCGQIVDRAGRDTGFRVSGTSCLRIADKAGVETGYLILGTTAPSVTEADGKTTGFVVSDGQRREFMGPDERVPWEEHDI